MHIHRRSAAVLIAAFGFGAGAAHAADSTIETMIVTGRKLEESLPADLAKYGTRVDVISAADIANGAYLDVAQSLQTRMPGVYVASKNGPFDYVDISFQGSRTEEVLWLVDGIRINNRLYAGTTPLDTMPASMIDHIEVVEGGQALFYGTQALAGAVNVVTKAFSDKPEGALTLGGDTNGGKHIDGYFSDAFDKHQIVVFGSEDQSNGYKPFPDADFQPSSTARRRGYDVLNLGGKYALNISDDLRLSADYVHTRAQLDFAKPFQAASIFNNRDEDLASAKIDYAPSETAAFYAKGYFHRWTSHYTEFDNVIGSPGTLSVVDDHDFWGYKDYGANLMAKLALNRGFEYVLGYDFQNYTGRDAVLVIQQQTESVNAVFGQIRTTADLIPDALFSVGARYNAPSIGESAVVWNATGQYNILSDRLFIRATGGTAFRLPTAEELFANDPNDELGNPNLKPERSIGVNASIGGAVPMGEVRLNWEVIGFHREIKDLIDLDTFNTATNQDVFGNVSGKVTTKGGEVVLGAAFGTALSADFSATYAQSRQAASTLQFNRIPETQLKGSLDFHPVDLPIGATATVNYVGDVYDTLGGGIGRRGYGNYAVVDVSARVFLDAARHHRINVQLENAFDRGYVTHLARGTLDISGGSYLVHDLGSPRTLSARYTYALN